MIYNNLHQVSTILLITITTAVASKACCSKNLSSKCQCETNKQNDIYISCAYDDDTATESILQNGSCIMQTEWKYLNISSTNISQLDDNLFRNVFSVKTVNLSNNNLHDVPKALSVIQKIRELDMSSNMIESNDFSAVKEKSIKILNMASNYIDRLTANCLQNLTSLVELNLSKNKISYIEPGSFLDVPKLRILDLSGNYLHSLSEMTFFGIEDSMQSLDVSANNIMMIRPLTFLSIHSLKVLILSENNGIHSLEDLTFPPHLAYLDVRAIGLEQLDECKISNLVDLEYLDIRENNLSCSCKLLQLTRHVHQHLIAHLVHAKPEMPAVTCTNEFGMTVGITDVTLNCEDNDLDNLHFECHHSMADHITNYLSLKSDLNLQVNLEKEEMKVSWKASKWPGMYGYKIIVNKENTGQIYESDIIHKTTTKFQLRDSNFASGDFSICLRVLLNQTYIVQQTCDSAKVASTQLVLGIVAGSAFLLPCISIFLYIYIKDRKMSHNQDDCEKLTSDEKASIVEEQVNQGLSYDESDIKVNQDKIILESSYMAEALPIITSHTADKIPVIISPMTDGLPVIASSSPDEFSGPVIVSSATDELAVQVITSTTTDETAISPTADKLPVIIPPVTDGLSASTTDELPEPVITSTSSSTDKLHVPVITSTTTDGLPVSVITSSTTDEVPVSVIISTTTDKLHVPVITSTTTDGLPVSVITSSTTDEVPVSVIISTTTDKLHVPVLTSITNDEIHENTVPMNNEKPDIT